MGMSLKDHEIGVFPWEIQGDLFMRGIIFKRSSYYNPILWNLAHRKFLYGSSRLWGIDFPLGLKMKNLHTPRLYIETQYPVNFYSFGPSPGKTKGADFQKNREL